MQWHWLISKNTLLQKMRGISLIFGVLSMHGAVTIRAWCNRTFVFLFLNKMAFICSTLRHKLRLTLLRLRRRKFSFRCFHEERMDLIHQYVADEAETRIDLPLDVVAQLHSAITSPEGTAFGAFNAAQIIVWFHLFAHSYVVRFKKLSRINIMNAFWLLILTIAVYILWNSTSLSLHFLLSLVCPKVFIALINCAS